MNGARARLATFVDARSLEAGVVIAERVPSAVRDDPHVIARHVGDDDRVIERSDWGRATPRPEPERCP